MGCTTGTVRTRGDLVRVLECGWTDLASDLRRDAQRVPALVADDDGLHLYKMH
jgi:hypothetical protein